MVFYVQYGCSCENVTEIVDFPSEEEAREYAYCCAIESYSSFEGLHGVRGLDDISEDLFEKELDDCIASELEEIEEAYEEEVESDIFFSVELFDDSNRDHLLWLECQKGEVY